ncbi:MAG TPA: dihydroorotase [Candidatus Hydrogenedentes bacterium]|nr:dihydroorotase [Candidatus Hydrogenedentota bacterium]HPC15535.1 dihydroorotase [Candidatus Hydrogenedentota bacterium]HRT19355.1 dihydroorotase [Candidatus Hydrogenedentota bacterium]HRT63911.1 dihydroorotase [Candidatus Hydrogenedentota bacterium]
MSLVIVNGHVIDPASARSERADVLIEGTRIERIGKGLKGGKTIDASGCVVCPGFVDIHVHFREPGQESKETIASGSRAAARGGYTSVVPMPNTAPPIDNAGMVEFVIRRARETACVKIWPSACATKERAGQEMTEMGELKDVGAVAVTDDGSDIASSWVLRRVLEYADMCGLTYLAHCEDASLMEGGCMNEGYNSTRLGLPGMPREMEEIRIDRNIRLAALTGAKIHIQHVTTAEGVEIIRRAKANGVRVTCETAPHYWMLTDEAVTTFSTNAKMNPPLREAADVAAIRAAIADGTIDCIATDHAPHTFTDKDVEFHLAPFGIVGLETALGLVLTGLVETDLISLERAVELMTIAPARILNLPIGMLREGGPADIVVFDPKKEWTVDPAVFASLSRNTPFAGETLRGQVKATLCDGNVVYQLA